MADITQLRFAQLLKRTLGLKAIDPGQVIAHQLVGTYDIQDTYRPEHRADRGERLLSMGIQISTTTTNCVLANLIAPAGGRTFVLRRAWFNLNLPTATTQPGQVYALIGGVNPATAPTQQAVSKDTRTPALSLATGLNVQNFTTLGPAAVIVNSMWFQQLFPQAALTPTTIVVDTLDVVLSPGNQVTVGLRADTFPTAGYNYNVFVEGYEYVPDVAELTAPPP